MKFIKYNTPKNKIQHVKNELKHRINVSNNAELYNIQKTFAYLPVLSNDIDDDFESLYDLILFKLKRMQTTLKNIEYFWYDRYGKSLDCCIKCFEIYLNKEDIDIDKINLNNIDEIYKKYLDSLENREITISVFKGNLYKVALQDYYKEKALKVAWHLLENKSGNWWV